MAGVKNGNNVPSTEADTGGEATAAPANVVVFCNVCNGAIGPQLWGPEGCCCSQSCARIYFTVNWLLFALQNLSLTAPPPPTVAPLCPVWPMGGPPMGEPK